MRRPHGNPPRNPSGSYFADDYHKVMYTGILGFFSKMSHRSIDRPFRGRPTPTVLEVGAGAGQHAQYASTNFERYYLTDISEEALRAYIGSDPRVVPQVADAQNLHDFADESVDRIVATCLLAHVDYPEQALLEWRRVLKPGGSVSIYVPTEPGMLLRLLRHIAVAPKSKKLGNDHLAIVYRDHRNHYPGMRLLIESVFAHDLIRRRRFPTRLLGWNFSLFDIFHISKCDNKGSS